MLRELYSGLFNHIEQLMKPTFLVYNTHHVINEDGNVDIGFIIKEDIDIIIEILNKTDVKKIIHGNKDMKFAIPNEFNSEFKDIVFFVILNEKKEYFLKITK